MKSFKAITIIIALMAFLMLIIATIFAVTSDDILKFIPPLIMGICLGWISSKMAGATEKVRKENSNE